MKPRHAQSRWAFLALALALLIVGPISTVPGAPAPKTLTIGLTTFPANMSPGHAGNASLMMLLQFSDGLTRHDASGKVVPDLAESWRLVDETTWEFKLRKGVKFHNGEPFNAQAVKFTYDRALDPNRPYSRRNRVNLVTSVDIVDDYTVRMKTSAPFPLLPFGTYAIVIEPPGYIKEVGDEGATRKPVGTGPFKVVEWVTDRQLVLEANPDYWDGRPKIDRVIFRNMPDASTRVSALKAGEVQIADKLPIDVAPTLESSSITVKSVKIAAGLVNTYNLTEDGPLRKLQVRQAIDMAIDRKTILQNIYRGHGGLLDGQLTVRGSVGYNPTLKATPYNPDKAKELLTQAGYPNGLSLTYVVPMNYQIGDHDIALAIVAQLKKVGIDLKLNEMEFATYSVGRGRGTLRDMYMVAWYDLGDAENALVLYTKRGGFSVWDNPEFEGVMQKARTTTNPNARQQFLREANAIMSRELPASFLFQVPAIYGVSKNVVGWEPRRDELVGWLYKVVLK